MVKSKRKCYNISIWIIFKEPSDSWHTVEHNFYYR